ncbi:hypothetical protein LY76DRAFT_588853 [Colletotrichum caudatum]|nr:hypothetical protein LY76DRAFT_588853 [Colletotrichum caudatum]
MLGISAPPFTLIRLGAHWISLASSQHRFSQSNFDSVAEGSEQIPSGITGVIKLRGVTFT